MSYTWKSFKDCRYNPLGKDLFSENERLEELIEGKNGFSKGQWEKLMKYIIANYDPASPLIKDYSLLPKRKQVAAELAGFDLIKDEKLLQDIYSCQSEEFTEVVNDYLKEYGDNRLWAMIVSSLQLFWEFNLRIFTPIKEDKDKDLVAAVNMKSKMSEELEKIHERIERLTKQFYGDDELQEATKRIRKTPESIAGL